MKTRVAHRNAPSRFATRADGASTGGSAESPAAAYARRNASRGAGDELFACAHPPRDSSPPAPRGSGGAPENRRPRPHGAPRPARAGAGRSGNDRQRTGGAGMHRLADGSGCSGCSGRARLPLAEEAPLDRGGALRRARSVHRLSVDRGGPGHGEPIHFGAEFLGTFVYLTDEPFGGGADAERLATAEGAQGALRRAAPLPDRCAGPSEEAKIAANYLNGACFSRSWAAPGGSEAFGRGTPGRSGARPPVRIRDSHSGSLNES